jgi:DNA-directed RNA polymerase subunit delta
MNQTKSMLDVAFELMSKTKKEVTFSDLYNQVAKTLDMSDDEKKSHIGEFFTEMTLDGRFVALTDNGWDLRARHTYDKVHIDVNDVYSDVEEGEEDEEDVEEEKEFEAQIEGKPVAGGDEPAAEETGEEADAEKPAVDDDVAALVGKKNDDF